MITENEENGDLLNDACLIGSTVLVILPQVMSLDVFGIFQA